MFSIFLLNTERPFSLQRLEKGKVMVVGVGVDISEVCQIRLTVRELGPICNAGKIEGISTALVVADKSCV